MPGTSLDGWGVLFSLKLRVHWEKVIVFCYMRSVYICELNKCCHGATTSQPNYSVAREKGKVWHPATALRGLVSRDCIAGVGAGR